MKPMTDITENIPIDMLELLTVDWNGERRLNELGLADLRVQNAEKKPSYETWEFAEKALRRSRQYNDTEKKVDCYRKLCQRLGVVRDGLDQP